MQVRQALNVEAGLNDGLSVPFLLFFIALGGGAVAGESARLTHFIIEQLGYGTLVGLLVGGVGVQVRRARSVVGRAARDDEQAEDGDQDFHADSSRILGLTDLPWTGGP